MQNEKKYFINGIPKLYHHLKEQGKEEEAKQLVKTFLATTFNEDLDDKVQRFLDIPGGLKPADMEYFKIYWELMQLYINGLFYSTVVLSGVLSERICYDILAQQKLVLEKKPLTEDQISCLYKMNLYDIIQLLSKWKLIKDETRREMIEINNKRNIYVHPSKTVALEPEKDSKEIIKRISKVLENQFEFKYMS